MIRGPPDVQVMLAVCCNERHLNMLCTVTVSACSVCALRGWGRACATTAILSLPGGGIVPMCVRRMHTCSHMLGQCKHATLHAAVVHAQTLQRTPIVIPPCYAVSCCVLCLGPVLLLYPDPVLLLLPCVCSLATPTRAHTCTVGRVRRLLRRPGHRWVWLVWSKVTALKERVKPIFVRVWLVLLGFTAPRKG